MPRDPQLDDTAPAEASIDDVALRLLALADNQSVRVIEALAAALMNALRERSGLEFVAPAPASGPAGLCEDPVAIENFGPQLSLCRRVARRALRGSLTDPTQGANAFHRIEESPAWARERLPIAMYGQYLFYRL